MDHRGDPKAPGLGMEGVEPPTLWFVAIDSNPLSYIPDCQAFTSSAVLVRVPPSGSLREPERRPPGPSLLKDSGTRQRLAFPEGEQACLEFLRFAKGKARTNAESGPWAPVERQAQFRD